MLDRPSVIFHWDNSYNIDNAIDHYHVMTIPSTNCSVHDIPPGVLYMCHGLQIGQDYSFDIGAVNCGDQQGERDTVMINFQSEW